jgi:phosphoserine/homoserine phosphotransferase
MNIVCLDLEGVLVPEIWIAVAEKTGIEGLKRTTRDEPDYDKLMQYRLDLLAEHKITLMQIQEVIQTLEPLDGAKEFIDWIVSQTRVIILSDTFEQFATPLMAQLGWPTLFCHQLIIDSSDVITGYKLRQQDHKRNAVLAFQNLNFRVIAGGDSYNDLSMLLAAEDGILFRPPECLAKEHEHLPVVESHADLRSTIEKLLL